jgi:hypothetical protein
MWCHLPCHNNYSNLRGYPCTSAKKTAVQEDWEDEQRYGNRIKNAHWLAPEVAMNMSTVCLGVKFSGHSTAEGNIYWSGGKEKTENDDKMRLDESKHSLKELGKTDEY